MRFTLLPQSFLSMDTLRRSLASILLLPWPSFSTGSQASFSTGSQANNSTSSQAIDSTSPYTTTDIILIIFTVLLFFGPIIKEIAVYIYRRSSTAWEIISAIGLLDQASAKAVEIATVIEERKCEPPCTIVLGDLTKGLQLFGVRQRRQVLFFALGS